MKHFATIICAGLVFSACETTKPIESAEIKVRPIAQLPKAEQSQKIDVSVQLTQAAKLQAAADFPGSYEAYKVLLLRMDADHMGRIPALLGLADSALALVWRDDEYAAQARTIYQKISLSAGITQPQDHRIKAGLLLLDLADYTQEAAQQHLQQALQDSPDDPRLWNALGRLHDQSNDWLGALDAYVKALSAAKENGQSTASVHNNMGMSLLMQDRKAEALTKFKQAVKARPDMAVYDNNLRMARTLSGQTGIALKGLSDTKIAQIYNDAGVIAQAQGDHKQAAKLYKKAIEKNPLYFKLAEENLTALGAKNTVKAP